METSTSDVKLFLSREIQNTRVDLTCAELSENVFNRQITRKSARKILQKMPFIRVRYNLYVSCSKSLLLPCSLMHAEESLLKPAQKSLAANFGHILSLAHNGVPSIPVLLSSQRESPCKLVIILEGGKQSCEIRRCLSAC